MVFSMVNVLKRLSLKSEKEKNYQPYLLIRLINKPAFVGQLLQSNERKETENKRVKGLEKENSWRNQEIVSKN